MITKAKSGEKTFEIATLMQASINRMSRLIDDVLDFARGRLGGGLTLQRTAKDPIGKTLIQVVAELRDLS